MIDLKKLESLNDNLKPSANRSYLGISGIGEKCYRKLQYDHYWAYTEQHSARMLRLFDTGHHFEDIMIKQLLEVGIVVRDQQKKIVSTSGHWKGHIDGLFTYNDKEYLIEFKTHNDKSFKDLKKQGVEKSKPGHYDQMQGYMGYLELSGALYMAMNKNDSEYYFESVPFNKERFDDLKRKQFEVIASEELHTRIGTGQPTWFECRFCSARHVCFNKLPIDANCRTCKNVIISDNGKWLCAIQDRKDLTIDEQKEGCNKYELGDMFR